jgi:hypothetical protein
MSGVTVLLTYFRDDINLNNTDTESRGGWTQSVVDIGIVSNVFTLNRNFHIRLPSLQLFFQDIPFIVLWLLIYMYVVVL